MRRLRLSPRSLPELHFWPPDLPRTLSLDLKVNSIGKLIVKSITFEVNYDFSSKTVGEPWYNKLS
jgi:hypothetical protein